MVCFPMVFGNPLIELCITIAWAEGSYDLIIETLESLNHCQSDELQSTHF